MWVVASVVEPAEMSANPSESKLRVGLFVTCLVDVFRPSIGFAAVKLLEEAGCEVVVPASQTCCGQPGYNSGDRRGAQTLARKLVHDFAACDYVVAPSGSCAGMIRSHYPELLAEFPEVADELARLTAKTYELTDFLVNVMKRTVASGGLQLTVTYHDSCSGLRELGIKSQPRALLRGLAGLAVKEMSMPEQCCGFGGTFAVKLPEISARICDQKCDDIVATEADAVVLGDLGCMLNIEGRLRRRGEAVRVLHVAEVLAGILPDGPKQQGRETS
jgi:L-lactate dehydrogenase complex protein LldE